MAVYTQLLFAFPFPCGLPPFKQGWNSGGRIAESSLGFLYFDLRRFKLLGTGPTKDELLLVLECLHGASAVLGIPAAISSSGVATETALLP